MLRSFKYINRHSGPYLSESVCHAMFSYIFMHEFFRQSSDTCAARALLRKKCYVFSHATVRQSQTPGLRVRYYDKSVMLKKNPSSNLFRGPSTISDGIPTQLAGPEPPPNKSTISKGIPTQLAGPQNPPQSTISKGIPTQPAGPQNPSNLDDFEGDVAPAHP